MGATRWSRDEIASRILAGEYLIIFEGQLLCIPPSWLAAHPGGSLAILHFVGRDATDEIMAYHCDETMKRLKGYLIGTVECVKGGWEPLVPPVMSGWVRRVGSDGKNEWFHEARAVRGTGDSTEMAPSSQILLLPKDSSLLHHRDGAPTLETLTPPPTDLSPKVQSQHSAAYKALHKKIADAGLYKTPYLTGYGPEVVRYTLLGAISAYTYRHDWLVTSAVFLGLMWHQLVFTAHDLGHMGVTHNWAVDRILGTIIADFIGGLSIGWWVDVSM
jgi:sphingolipid 8-(E)-desaturase